MKIHHTKHHQGYVDKLKAALEKEGEVYEGSMEKLLKNINRYSLAVRNHGGGHYNHSLFWESLTPKSDKQPSGRLAVALRDSFGSVGSFIKSFSDRGAALFGSGWTWLCMDAQKHLKIVTTPNQDNPLMDQERWGIPLLGLDVWEHAYYLKYENRRAEYIDAFWHIINWGVVERRYNAAFHPKP